MTPAALLLGLVTLERLGEVDYKFAEPELQAANREFLADLATYAESQKDKPFAPLRDIATSIQY